MPWNDTGVWVWPAAILANLPQAGQAKDKAGMGNRAKYQRQR